MNMEKRRILGSLAVAAVATLMMSARQADEVMTKEGSTYVVNTTTLAKDVEGYVENTPLKIYIKDDKIERIEALPNQESPKYFRKVKQEMLNRWNGKGVKKAMREMKAETLDGVTGATYSSNAVSENLRRGLKYYLKHK